MFVCDFSFPPEHSFQALTLEQSEAMQIGIQMREILAEVGVIAFEIAPSTVKPGYDEQKGFRGPYDYIDIRLYITHMHMDNAPNPH